MGYWVARVVALGREAVALEFLTSNEYRARTVRADYADLLQRVQPPTAAEVESWIDSRLSLFAIRAGIEGSAEFMLQIA